MSDTQWPRFEVFLQEEPEKPFRNAGSVHAPDAEMALLNARDVFVRRPRCYRLWVVPAETILARSYQELEESGQPRYSHTEVDEGASENYYVFQKNNQRPSMTYVGYQGEVRAQSAEEALYRALRSFGSKPAYVWWVFPVDAVNSSSDSDVDSLFAPAEEKTYKMPKAYRVLAEMQEARNQLDIKEDNE